MSEELTIPAFCIISPEDRKAAWARYDAIHPKEETMKAPTGKALQVQELRIKRATKGRAGATTSADARKETLRAMVDAVDAPKKTNFDQALAGAQGRGLDAMMLGTEPLAAPAPAQPQETTMKTAVNSKPKKTTAKKPATRKPAAAKTTPKAKTTASANARTPVKPAADARPDGLRKDSKQAKMIDLALRDEGATEQAICKELGWKKCRVTLKRVAEKIGAKLEGKKNVAGETVWFATMPKKA